MKQVVLSRVWEVESAGFTKDYPGCYSVQFSIFMGLLNVQTVSDSCAFFWALLLACVSNFDVFFYLFVLSYCILLILLSLRSPSRPFLTDRTGRGSGWEGRREELRGVEGGEL